MRLDRGDLVKVELAERGDHREGAKSGRVLLGRDPVLRFAANRALAFEVRNEGLVNPPMAWRELAAPLLGQVGLRGARGQSLETVAAEVGS